MDGAGLPTPSVAKFPHLAGATALVLANSDLAKVPDILKGQIVIAKFAGTRLIDATAVQTPGVLDDATSRPGYDPLQSLCFLSTRSNTERVSLRIREKLAEALG